MYKKARLIEYDANLQKIAVEAESVKPVSNILSKSIKNRREDRVSCNSLLFIASVCSLHVDGRRIVAKLTLPTIVDSLSHNNSRIKAAACRALLSLSRSLRHLRTSLVDAKVAFPLVKVYLSPFLSSLSS